MVEELFDYETCHNHKSNSLKGQNVEDGLALSDHVSNM